MDYSKLVPSRELCEEMARLGICQDEPELWYVYNKMFVPILDTFILTDKSISARGHLSYIAPTLPRMMEELPSSIRETSLDISKDFDGIWYVSYSFSDGCSVVCYTDKHLPNAIAKALIVIKGKYA